MATDRETAQKAVQTAQAYKYAYENLRDMLIGLATIADTGRERGKSPAMLVDAMRRDIRSMAEGVKSMNDVRRTADVVYGREAVDASQREAERMMDLMTAIFGK